MKIDKIQESIELCTEAGWYAYDFHMERPVDRDVILALGSLGEMTYLSMLKQPFFRIERRYMMIKGLQGQSRFRVAMYKEEEENVLQEVKKLVEHLPERNEENYE